MKNSQKLTRREFHARAAAGLALLSGGAQAQARGSGPYVDVHTHLGMEWGDRPALTVELLLEWMDSKNVSQAVVLPLISPEAWDHPISTDYVLKKTAAHRDRLIPFCSIDPRTTNLSRYELIVNLLRAYQDAGARGFGEHKPGVPIDHPNNVELFAACAEVGLPVLFHLDTIRNTDQPGLPGLARVLEQVPDGVFIGHAQGWWASIDGGVGAADLQRYPNSKVEAGGALDALMDRFPNLYGDLSAGSGANAIARDREFGRAFLIRRQDRLLFGTDYLAPGQEVPQFELYESLDLPDSVKAKIFRENARRVLRLA